MQPIALRSALLTLFSGGSTREVLYAPDKKGNIRIVEQSDWDGTVSGPVATATIEFIDSTGRRQVQSMTGHQYLQLQEDGAIEDVLHAVLQGKPPSDAILHALMIAGASA